jgi:hypothetical protein
MIAVGLLIFSVIALGVEIFINDIDNTTAIVILGNIAIVCLNINAAAAIYKSWKTGSDKEKVIAIFLTLLIIAFWIIKAVEII